MQHATQRSHRPTVIPEAVAAGVPYTRLPVLGWDAPVYCHAPADAPFEARMLAEADARADRWSLPCQPTVYLASDAGVALAELARHHDASASLVIFPERLEGGPDALVRAWSAVARVEIGR